MVAAATALPLLLLPLLLLLLRLRRSTPSSSALFRGSGFPGVRGTCPSETLG